jgi:hypothetical protein
MPNYRVEIEAEFNTSSSSVTALRQKILRLVKENGFTEKNFEIGITLLKQEKTRVKDGKE